MTFIITRLNALLKKVLVLSTETIVVVSCGALGFLDVFKFLKKIKLIIFPCFRSFSDCSKSIRSTKNLPYIKD